MSGNKYRYLAKNTLIFSISSFGSKLLAFLLVPFYTHLLTTAEYGTADLVTTTASLLVFAVTICIQDAVLRFGIDKEHIYKGVFRYGLEVIAKGVSLFGAGLIIFSFFNPFHWEGYIFLFLFLTLTGNAINQIVSNYLRAIDRIYSVAIMGILTTVFAIVSNILLILVFRLGVLGYLLSFVIGYFSASIYGLIVIYKYDKKSFFEKSDKKTRKMMRQYALPLIPNGLAWWMNSSLDRYFIIFFWGLPVNGLYAVASKIPTILNVVNQIFHQAWNLSAIREYDKEDSDGFFSNMYSLYNYVLVVSCSILIMLNIALAKALFAKDFFTAWHYSSILLLSAVFSALSGFIGSVFVAVKKSKVFAISTVIAAAVNMLLNWILIPPLAATGAAIATVISFFVIWLIRYICAIKYIKLNIHLYRDVIAYLILVGQVVIEHVWPHAFYLQAVLLVGIIAMYRDETVKCIKRIKRIVASVLNKKRHNDNGEKENEKNLSQ